MKKVLSIVIVGVVLASALFAFDGTTSVGLEYSYEDGHHMGLSVDNFGFGGTSRLGYYIGAEGLFNIEDFSEWKIGVIAGPSYRYPLNSNMLIIASLGFSAEGTEDKFSIGVGSFFKGEYKLNDHISLSAGVKFGNNFASIPYEGGELETESMFYATPVIGVGFCY